MFRVEYLSLGEEKGRFADGSKHKDFEFPGDACNFVKRNVVVCESEARETFAGGRFRKAVYRAKDLEVGLFRRSDEFSERIKLIVVREIT